MRIQHRSGALWLLNSAALRARRLEADAPTGELWREDARLAERLPRSARRPTSAGSVASSPASASPPSRMPPPTCPLRSQQLLAAAVSDGRLPQRVMLLGGRRRRSCTDRITLGPLKIVLGDHEPPDLDWMRDRVLEARAAGAGGRRPLRHARGARRRRSRCSTRSGRIRGTASSTRPWSTGGDRRAGAARADRRHAARLHRRPRRRLPPRAARPNSPTCTASSRCAPPAFPVVCSSDAPVRSGRSVGGHAGRRRAPHARRRGARPATSGIAVRQALRGYLTSPSLPGRAGAADHRRRARRPRADARAVGHGIGRAAPRPRTLHHLRRRALTSSRRAGVCRHGFRASSTTSASRCAATCATRSCRSSRRSRSATRSPSGCAKPLRRWDFSASRCRRSTAAWACRWSRRPGWSSSSATPPRRSARCSAPTTASPATC